MQQTRLQAYTNALVLDLTLKALLSPILSLGCTETDEAFDRLRVQTLNIGIATAIVVAFVTAAIAAAFQQYDMALGATAFTLIGLAILKLQHSRNHSVAVVIMSTGSVGVIWAQFVAMGPQLGLHLWLIALIIFPLLTMPRRNTRLALFLSVSQLGILLVLGIQDQKAHGYSDDYLITLILAASLVLIMSASMRLFLDKIESAVDEARFQEKQAKAKIIDFPMENPHPVFRVNTENLVIFANLSATLLLNEIGIGIGDAFLFDLSQYAERADENHTLKLPVGDSLFSLRVSGLSEYGFWNVYGTDSTQIQVLQDNQVEMKSVLTNERELSRLKEEFLASLSHELRTPLNAIMGLSEALNEKVYGPLNEKQTETLETIWTSGQSLLLLINDMLDFSRIGAGKYQTLIGQNDLRACIEAAVYSCADFAKDSKVEIIVEPMNEPLMAAVDGRHIIRVLKILLNNGIKFTPEGRTIGIRVLPNEDADHITIQVWDKGIGIRPEKLKTLFDPFSQVDGGLSRQYEGAGLGLALSARLCRLLGASIEADSTIQRGSTFTLKIPIATPQWIEVFSDLRCPFCYILDDWLESANMSHLVRWRGVEEIPGLTAKDGASEPRHEKLKKVLENLRELYPDTKLTHPKQVSNTRRALAALVRVGDTESARHAEARLLLYRAIWVEGKDITDWPAIREVLVGFDIADLNDDSPELATVTANSNEWRTRGENRIPSVFALHSNQSWHGLGQRVELINFVERELGINATQVET